MENKHYTILTRALKLYGEEKQIDMMIEEAGELIVALQHFKRKRITKKKVCTEIADVKNVIHQMEFIFGKFDVNVQQEMKAERLQRRMIVSRQKSNGTSKA